MTACNLKNAATDANKRSDGSGGDGIIEKELVVCGA